MVTGVVIALAPKNCDDVFNLHQKAVDGVYGVSIGRSIIQTYCEFGRNGFNWMVRKTNHHLHLPFVLKVLTINFVFLKPGIFSLQTGMGREWDGNEREWNGNGPYAKDSTSSIL